MHFLLKTDGSLSVHFGSWHAVYSDYIPDTTKGSPVLPAFSLSVKIFGIHNHFSVRQRLLLPGSSGSSGTGSLFHSGYFHRIPDIFPKKIFDKYSFLFPLAFVHFFQKWHQRPHIVPVLENIRCYNVFAVRCDLDVISRFQLSIPHVVVFHVHKGGVRICFTKIIPPLKAGGMPVIDRLALQKMTEQLQISLISAFPFSSSMYKNRPIRSAVSSKKLQIACSSRERVPSSTQNQQT